MADRHRTARHQELERHRPADDIRLADDDRMLPDQIFARFREQPHAAERRARSQSRHLDDESADVVRVKSVDVLVRIETLDYALGIDLLRQRQLESRIPFTAGSPLSVSTSASTSASLAVAGRS